jgi:hypothetical protein
MVTYRTTYREVLYGVIVMRGQLSQVAAHVR